MSESKELQVCFVTTTQYQFMIADIYARYISDNYGIRPVVFNRTFPNFDANRFDTDGKYEMVPYTIHNKNVVGQCLFAFQCGYLYHLSKWSRILDPQKRTVLFVFNDMSKLANRLMNEIKSFSADNRIFIVDEGNSTYSDSIDLKNERLWKLKHHLSKLVFGYGRATKVVGESPLIDGAIVKDVERYSSLKKAKHQDVRQQNRDILQHAGDFFCHYEAANVTGLESDIIFMGQPFYQNGKFFQYEDDCIEAVFAAIPEGLVILIKPHPRDLIRKYKGLTERHRNVTLISEDLAAIPIEALLEITKAKIVITIQSSAAVTVADLYPGITSLVLKNLPQAQLMLEKLKETGDEGPVIGDDAFTGKNCNIFLPSSVDECAKIIMETVSKERKVQSTTTEIIQGFSEIDEIITEMRDEG